MRSPILFCHPPPFMGARDFGKHQRSNPPIPSEVEVDAVHAALTSALGQPDVRLQNCARWPLHQSCGQECLVQLDLAPEECLVRGVMMRWYRSKACVYCGKQFEQIQLIDHKPALIGPEGQLFTWRELVGKDLLTSLTNLKPVCWD